MPQLVLLGSGSAEAAVPFHERLADHDALLDGYFTTLLTRNFSPCTRQYESNFLRGWFKGQMIRDRAHAAGQRQLLLWEAMRPAIGRQMIMAFSEGLVLTGLRTRTVQTYLGSLRRLFSYILEYPYIPLEKHELARGSTPRSIVAKYGAIEQPVLEVRLPRSRHR